MSLYAPIPRWIKVTPDRFKSKEMCNEAVRINPLSLRMSLTNLKLKKCVVRQ